jgi:NAD(P)-dependent dehydrogenase (short-subunit alcohol dehydrogenase family)
VGLDTAQVSISLFFSIKQDGHGLLGWSAYQENATMDFTGKTAIVTGAARGLGFSYARELARLGAQVVISDIGADTLGDGADPQVVQAAALALQGEGLRVVGHAGDLSGEAGCRALIECAITHFGQLDILIHNAGWVGYQPIEAADEAFIRRAMDVNVYAPIWLCKHAWQHLTRSAAPRIVLTTSDRAMYTRYVQPGLAAYSAGKMAQLGIKEMPSANQAKALLSGDTDIAFLRYLPGQADNIESRLLLDEPILLALPADHPNADDAAIELKDFAGADFVFTPQALGSGYHHQLIALCEAAGFSPRVVQEADQLPTLIGLVACGFGVALVPQSIARSMPRDKVAFVPLTAASSSIGLYLNWNTSHSSPLAGHFFSLLDEAM